LLFPRPPPPPHSLFPSTTLFRSDRARRLSARLMPSTVRVLVSALGASLLLSTCREDQGPAAPTELKVPILASVAPPGSVTFVGADRKSTRLNSSHEWISYAVFCL